MKYKRYTAELADGRPARFWHPDNREYAAFDIVRPLSGGSCQIRKHGAVISERGRLEDAKERLERS